jgi:hypothetical protein
VFLKLPVLVGCSLVPLLSFATVAAQVDREPAKPAPPVEAEELLEVAIESNTLSDTQVERASELLSSSDPFDRGLAWWAIAVKVGMDNHGFDVVWPKSNPPGWYIRWASAPPSFHLEADYVRQLAEFGLHRRREDILLAAGKTLKRAETIVEMTPAQPDLAPARSLYAELAQQVESSASVKACRTTYIRFRHAARKVILSNPDIDFDRIVFVTQYQAHTRRNITRSFPWKHKPGGDICVLSGFRDGGAVTPLINGQLGRGFVWGLDLHWDADRMVFSFAKHEQWPPPLQGSLTDRHHELRNVMEPLHVYEINSDGQGLRQLTDHPVWSDFEPAYCPNGDIVFPSDRKGNAAQCGNFPNDVSNPNLYICSPDGSEVRKLTDFKDLDRYPRALDNGRIAFTRWEYQERHFMEAHAIWTIRPDGTMADNYFGHHLAYPLSFRDARSIPDSNKLVAVAAGHHTFAHGPVVIIDNSRGLNDSRGISIVTPGAKPQEGGMSGASVPEGGVPGSGVYRQPYALSEKSFLVAYAYDQLVHPIEPGKPRALSNGFGLYYVDVWGAKELLYRHPCLSCANPIPLKSRPCPPLLPSQVDASKDYAVCSTLDVYEGVPDIKRGTIKYIRISQHLPWSLDEEAGKKPYIPGSAYSPQYGYTSWSPVRVIGTVPVEADGSAYFQVPVDTSVYFQALDENHMEVRRMRSMVAFKPGEERSCTGCHETRGNTPPAMNTKTAALQRPPSRPIPPSWGDDVPVDYETLIQPILDARCTRCHGGPEPAGNLDLSADKDGGEFCRSYRNLLPDGHILRRDTKNVAIEMPLISISNRFSDGGVTPPYAFGSHRSKLTLRLLDDKEHREESGLTEDEWRTIVTWVDANAPYYGSFINKRPAGGGPPKRESIAPPRLWNVLLQVSE